MKTYKLTEVKKVCDVIYGKVIDLNTWTRWKRKLLIPKSVREIEEMYMEQLIILTSLKRKKPHSNPSLFEVVKSKKQIFQEFIENKKSYVIFLLPDNCLGSEIIEIIKMITGREITRQTLYRWGEETGVRYSASKNYSKDEIYRLISKMNGI